MVKKKSKNTGLIPEKGSINVAKAVFGILEQVVADKDALGLENKWYRFYEMGKGKHWRKDSADLTLATANLMSVHRRRTVNTLTDNNPTFNVNQIIADEDTEEKFKTVLRATEYWWNETEQQDVLELSVFNGETYGICIEKSIFDLDKEYGIGEVDTLIVDPYHFGIYPVKCLDIQKAQAVLHFYPMSVQDIKRVYGNAAVDVVPDSEVVNSISDSRRLVSGVKETTVGVGGSSMTSFGGAIRKLVSFVSGNGSDDSDEAVVVECWVKDYTQNEDSSGPLYPGYIRAITAVNGSIVLSDKSNPSINPNLPIELASNTYLYDKFPFAKANSNKDPVNFWGEGDFEQLVGLQMELNKSLSQFATLKDKVAGTKFVNPKTSGVHNNKITSGATVLNPETQNHGMHWLESPPIPKELIGSMEMYKELFFAVAGTFDLEQANTPGSQVIAYKAIAALLERASTMMRGKIRNYSKLVRDRGRMSVSQMQNWYTEPRFMTFKEKGNEHTGQALGKDMIVPLKLSVVSGSTMPVSQVQRREEALTLYDKNAIDTEELLKFMEWPKVDEVVTRMNNGPVSEFIDKMLEAGMPEEMSEYMNEVSALDENKLERALDRTELPFFNQVFNFEGMEPDAKQEIDLAKAEAEVNESSARTDKIIADTEAVSVSSEKELASIRQTDERIKIDRGKTVADAKSKERELNLKEIEVNKPETNNAIT